MLAHTGSKRGLRSRYTCDLTLSRSTECEPSPCSPPPLNRDYNAETLFLDTATDTGVVVRPKPGRAVLMDQDVLHR